MPEVAPARRARSAVECQAAPARLEQRCSWVTPLTRSGRAGELRDMNDKGGAARKLRDPGSRRGVLVFALGAWLGLGGAGCASLTSNAQGFRTPTLDGDVFDASDHLGKSPLLITFWKVTCAPCQQQMPVFAELQHTYAARGLVVVAISIDGPASRAQVRARAIDAGIDFPVLLDEDSTIFNRYSPSHELPLTLIVNRDGSVRERFAGLYFTGPSAGLAREIEAALADRRADTPPAPASPGEQK
jgi:peroxiredoxin